MTSRLRVVIADDVAETRDNVAKLLQFEEKLEVVGSAANGEQAVQLAQELKPDIILMDINMPGLDGIAATEQITEKVPDTVIIIMSVQGEQEYLRKAMIAGARDYLTKPFSGDELINTVYQIWEMEEKRRRRQGTNKVRRQQVISVVGSKGGSGKSIIAVNLAVALAQQTHQTILLDLDLQFGDTAALLNLTPTRTIVDFVEEQEEQPAENFLSGHLSGVRTLVGPARLEQAELVSPQQVGRAVQLLKAEADYLIIDTPQTVDEKVLQSWELADQILLVGTPDLPNLKNLRRSLELFEQLQLAEKVHIILNQVGLAGTLAANEFVRHLGVTPWVEVPHDSRLVNDSVNQGKPFVLTQPKARISQSLIELAAKVSGQEKESGRRRWILF